MTLFTALAQLSDEGLHGEVTPRWPCEHAHGRVARTPGRGRSARHPPRARLLLLVHVLCLRAVHVGGRGPAALSRGAAGATVSGVARDARGSFDPSDRCLADRAASHGRQSERAAGAGALPYE